MRTFIITIVCLAVAASTASAAGTAGKSGFFKTPDKKIWCGWGTGPDAFIVCGIKGGKLKPKPKNNCKVVDYVGNRIG